MPKQDRKMMRNTPLQQVGSRCVSFNLRRTARAVSRLYDACLAPSGLRSTQFTILMALHCAGPLTLTKLADSLVAERTTLTRNIGLLERKGLLRTESGQDRRKHHIVITEEGRAMLEAALPHWEEAQEIMEAGLGRERLERLMTDLADLVETARR